MQALRVGIEVLRIALTDVARRPAASLLAALAMAVAVYLMAFFTVVAEGLRDLFGTWSDQAAIEVFLHDEVPDARFEELARELEAQASVRRVSLVSADQALREFRELYADLEDVETLLGENPFPRSLRLVPARTDTAEIDVLVASLQKRPEVETLRYDREWIRSLGRLGQALAVFVAVGSLLLLSAALATVGSVVRLALDDKSDEVALMRLVGAPTSFVLLPVLLAGALLAFFGALGALGALDVTRELLLGWARPTPLGDLTEMLLGGGLAPGRAPLFVLGAAAAGALAAGLSAGRAALR